MFLAVDRIEGDKAVLQNDEGQSAAVPMFLLPEISEGDVLEISVNAEEAERRRKACRERMNRLRGGK